MANRKINENKTPESRDEVVETQELKGYEPPRIITHSAEGLQRVSLSVNACTGFDFGQFD